MFATTLSHISFFANVFAERKRKFFSSCTASKLDLLQKLSHARWLSTHFLESKMSRKANFASIPHGVVSTMHLWNLASTMFPRLALSLDLFLCAILNIDFLCLKCHWWIENGVGQIYVERSQSAHFYKKSRFEPKNCLLVPPFKPPKIILRLRPSPSADESTCM